ncbi:hypothetical protein AGMMS50267_00130 [Spirochaetia bacterium]|nr:hypothetical protein AGMMS50267_00130 [Spirochaetia bacterium]
MNYRDNHLFWGSASPLSTLTGAGLLILASSRTAFALVTAGALLWTYALTVMAARLTGPVLPQKGKDMIIICLSSVLGSFYLLFLFLTNPFLALEMSLIVSLVPVCCFAANLVKRAADLEPEDALWRALAEALVFGGLIFAVSLIREPLGFGSLSLPGGNRGIIELFRAGNGVLFPVRIFGSSAGALLLLGYGAALFHHYRKAAAETPDGVKSPAGPSAKIVAEPPVKSAKKPPVSSAITAERQAKANREGSAPFSAGQSAKFSGEPLGDPLPGPPGKPAGELPARQPPLSKQEKDR